MTDALLSHARPANGTEHNTDAFLRATVSDAPTGYVNTER